MLWGLSYEIILNVPVLSDDTPPYIVRIFTDAMAEVSSPVPVLDRGSYRIVSNLAGNAHNSRILQE